MTDHERAQLRADENHELFAIRRAERRMLAEQHRLEREMTVFEGDLQHAEDTIDEELRAEHGGHEPEHLPFWRVPGARHRTD